MGYYDYWSKKNTVTKPGFIGNWWRTWWKTNRLFGKKKVWALANYNRKKYYYNRKFRRSKYLKNYFYYRFDCHLYLEIPEIEQTIQFKTNDNNPVGSTNDRFKFRPFYLFFAPVDHGTSSKWNQFKILFKYFKCNGILLEYKPYAITAPEETFGDQKPNLMFYILLRSELNKFLDPANATSVTSNGYFEGINSLKENPYVRIVSFDDRFRFYRPFPYKNVNTLANDEQMFYQFVDIDISQDYYPDLIIGCYPTQPLPSLPQGSNLKFGDLDLSIYFTFKSNDI